MVLKRFSLFSAAMSVVLCSVLFSADVHASGVTGVWHDVYDGIAGHESDISSGGGLYGTDDFLKQEAIADNNGSRLGDFYFFENVDGYDYVIETSDGAHYDYDVHLDKW